MSMIKDLCRCHAFLNYPPLHMISAIKVLFFFFEADESEVREGSCETKVKSEKCPNTLFYRCLNLACFSAFHSFNFYLI